MKLNKFQQYALKVPADIRCIQTGNSNSKFSVGHICFGVRENAKMGWSSISSIEADITSVSFNMVAAENVPLVSSFVDSGYAEKVVHLSIGSSRGGDYDQTAAVSKLKGFSFPELRVLELGINEGFYFAHTRHGSIGDVTDILACCPKLETLGLYGEFTLRKSISLRQLKNLIVEPADDSTGEQSIEQSTFYNVFNSEFPVLEKIRFNSVYRDEIFDDDTGKWIDWTSVVYQVDKGANVYRFPSNFLKPNRMPGVKSIHMVGEFEKGQKSLFLESEIGIRASANHLVDGIVEVYK